MIQMDPVEHFSVLLDMLKIAFREGSSEEQYHEVVKCLRAYRSCPADKKSEKMVLLQKGWPPHYHPCHHMENIRWGICFGNVNAKLQELLTFIKQQPPAHIDLF